MGAENSICSKHASSAQRDPIVARALVGAQGLLRAGRRGAGGRRDPGPVRPILPVGRHEARQMSGIGIRNHETRRPNEHGPRARRKGRVRPAASLVRTESRRVAPPLPRSRARASGDRGFGENCRTGKTRSKDNGTDNRTAHRRSQDPDLRRQAGPAAGPRRSPVRRSPQSQLQRDRIRSAPALLGA
jgi:hypothetical protein